MILDVLIIFSQVKGPGPLQSMKLVQASKRWTTVKVVYVRKVGEATEYFTNQGRLHFGPMGNDSQCYISNKNNKFQLFIQREKLKAQEQQGN